jgi:hypothetical protein
VGLIATSIISNTVEDFLVMVISGGVAYASILNLPLRCAQASRLWVELNWGNLT